MEANYALLPKRKHKINEKELGKKTRFYSNFYEVSLGKKATLYQYSLDTEPEIPNDSLELLY